jgi:hypothetical protein
MKTLIKDYFLSTHKSVDNIEVFKNDEEDVLFTVFLTQGNGISKVTFRHDLDSDMVSVIRNWALDQILK